MPNTNMPHNGLIMPNISRPQNAEHFQALPNIDLDGRIFLSAPGTRDNDTHDNDTHDSYFYLKIL